MSLKRMRLVLFLILALAQPAVSFAACPIERARYRMVHGGQFTAGFYQVKKYQDWISSLVFFVHSQSSNRTHWFMFDQGTARYISLIAIDDVLAKGWTAPNETNLKPPMDGMDYLAADAGLNFNPNIPTPKDRPPVYIVLPDLPDVMARSAKPPETAPADIFKFYRCAAPGDTRF